MAAAAGDGAGEARARALLQQHRPFATPPGEYHHFGAPSAATDEMVEAVVLRTPVSSRELVVCWSCAEIFRCLRRLAL
jgi:transcription factor E2F3